MRRSARIHSVDDPRRARGVVLAEMLTAESPFQRESVTAVLFAILNEPPKGIERVHPELQKILFRCLAKDPEKRYSTALDLRAALEEANRTLPSNETPAATSTRRETSDIRRAREAASRSGVPTCYSRPKARASSARCSASTTPTTRPR